MNYTIEVGEQELAVILKALDMYMRTGMGQLDVSLEEFLRTHFYEKYYNVPCGDSEDPSAPVFTRGQIVAEYIGRIKALVFGHPRNGSWGIFNPEVPETCRLAHDIHDVLRHVRWKSKPADVRERTRYTVDADPPALRATKTPLWVRCSFTREGEP